jgi:16S rRNA (uracil1498-N3)-methyltransferase
MKQLFHAIPDQPVEFAADRATRQRLAHILRLRPGAEIVVADGTGLRVRTHWTGRGFDPIAAPECVAAATPQVALGVGVVKGERWDWLIEKATEVGVDRIVPLHLDHGVVRIDARDTERRLERWRATAAAAFEQCGRATLPEIARPVSLPEWLAELDRGSLLVCDERPDAVALRNVAVAPGASVALLVGPEGGLSAAERNLVGGARFVSLGANVLRAETAAVVAVALVRNIVL